MLTPQQLEDRFSGIGGSDAAAVLGLSPRMTARELYHQKRREIPDKPNDDDDELAWLGNAIEPVLAARYTERTGRPVRRVSGTRRHRTHKFILAHPDRLVRGEKRGLELKMRVSGLGWGQEGTDQVPDDVLLQCQHYMTVYGYPVWDVLAFIGGTGTRLYTIPRDPLICRDLLRRHREFWERVQTGDPPDLDYDHRTALDVVQALHPGTDGRVIQFPEQFEHWHAVLQDSKRLRDRYDAAAKTARAHLEEFMGDAAVAMFADGGAYHRREVYRAPYTADETRYVSLRFKPAPRGSR